MVDPFSSQWIYPSCDVTNHVTQRQQEQLFSSNQTWLLWGIQRVPPKVPAVKLPRKSTVFSGLLRHEKTGSCKSVSILRGQRSSEEGFRDWGDVQGQPCASGRCRLRLLFRAHSCRRGDANALAWLEASGPSFPPSASSSRHRTPFVSTKTSHSCTHTHTHPRASTSVRTFLDVTPPPALNP